MMRAGRCAGVVVTMLVAATACSDGDEAAPATTVAVVVTTAPPTTAAPTTAPPTTAATTTAPPTTAPPTTLPPTTPPPTTTPATDLRAEIEAALNQREQGMFDIGADPASPDLASKLAAYLSGSAYDKTLDFFEELAGLGFVLQPNPTVASKVVVIGEPIVVSDNPRRVQADICWIDAGVIVDPPDATGGPTFVVNDAVVRLTVVTELVSVDGRWIQDSWERTAEDQLGVATCD